MNTGVQVSAALAQLTGQVVCMQHGVNGQGYYTALSEVSSRPHGVAGKLKINEKHGVEIVTSTGM